MKKIIYILSSMLIVGSVVAGEKSQDLSQIYQLATKHNAQYLATQSTFKATQQNIPVALGKLLPHVDATYNGKYNFNLSNNNGSESSKYVSQDATLTGVQALFNWSAWGAYDYADFQAKADAISLTMAQSNLILMVAKAYFAILEAQDQLAFANANKTWDRQLLKQIIDKYDAGVAVKSDVQTIKAQYEQAGATEVAAKNAVETSFSVISQIIGQPVTSIHNLSANFPFLRPSPSNMKSWIAIAQKQNYQVVQNQLLLSAAKAGLSASDGAFLPTVNLVGSLGWSKSNQSHNSQANKTAQLGVQANLNLLNGGSDYAAHKKQKYVAQTAQYTLLEAQRAAESQSTINYLNVLSSIAQIKAYKEAVLAANTAVNSVRSSYDVGTNTIVDLLQQQQKLFEVQQQYAQAKYAYINNLLALKNTAGVLSYTDVNQINKWLTVSR